MKHHGHQGFTMSEKVTQNRGAMTQRNTLERFPKPWDQSAAAKREGQSGRAAFAVIIENESIPVL